MAGLAAPWPGWQRHARVGSVMAGVRGHLGCGTSSSGVGSQLRRDSYRFVGATEGSAIFWRHQRFTDRRVVSTTASWVRA